MSDDIKYKKYKKKFDKIMSNSNCRQFPVFVSSANCRRPSKPYCCGACRSCCGNPCMPCLDDEENFIESIMPFIRCLPILKKMQLRTLYLGSIYEIMLESRDEACIPVFPPYKPSKPVCMQDDDELFYWGLIPHLKSLSPEKRLKSRVVLFENLYNVYGDESTGYGDGNIDGYDKKMKYIDKLRELNQDVYSRDQNDGQGGEYGGYSGYGRDHDFEEEVIPRKTTGALESGRGPKKRGEFAEGGEFSKARGGGTTTSSPPTKRPGTPFGVNELDNPDTSLFTKEDESASLGRGTRTTTRRGMLKSSQRDDGIYSKPSQENLPTTLPNIRSMVSIKIAPSVRTLSEIELDEASKKSIFAGRNNMASSGKASAIKSPARDPSTKSLAISQSSRTLNGSKSVLAFQSRDLIKSRQNIYDKY